MTVKNRLKHWRHKHEMNQTQFGELLGIDQSQYSRYERQHDQPTLKNALLIAQKLKIPVEEIFYLVDEAGD